MCRLLWCAASSFVLVVLDGSTQPLLVFVTVVGREGAWTNDRSRNAQVQDKLS